MEDVKVVMEALRGLGGDAKTAFIWWLICNYIFYYVTVSFCLGSSLLMCYKILFPLFERISFIEEIKKAMGFNGNLINSEKRKIIQVLSTYKIHQDEKRG